MASEKMTYWAAVGIMAVLLGNQAITRIDSHCLRQRAIYAMQRLSGSANEMASRAQLVIDRDSSRYDHVQSQVACAQSRIAYAQGLLARKEAQLAQAQAMREQRVIIMDQMRNSMRVPRPRIEVVVPHTATIPNDDTI